MKTREMREAAAQLLEDEDWCQGATQNQQGARCMVGAIDYASEWEDPAPAYDELREELAIPHLEAWNDEPGRTVEDVLAALRGESQ